MADPLYDLITPRQLDHWCRKGYIRAEAPGSGNKRLLNFRERAVAEWMGKLVKAGFTVPKAAELARQASAGESRFRLDEGLILVIAP